MAKEAIYFSHDANSHRDQKTIALRIKHGWQGYGLFWAIVERLRESSDYMCVCDYNIIAYDLRIDAAIIKSIICDFGLFSFTDDGKCFYSERLMRSMELKEIKSQKARESVKSRWNKNESNTNVIQTYNDSNTNKEKKRKVKEKKENKEPIEIRKANFKTQVLIFQKDYSTELLKSFFEYWTETTPGGSKMKFELQRTWETGKRLITWKANEAKFKGSKEATVVKLPTYNESDIPVEVIN